MKNRKKLDEKAWKYIPIFPRETLHIARISPHTETGPVALWDKQAAVRRQKYNPKMPLMKEEMKLLPQGKQS